MNVLGLDLSITATGIARPDGTTRTITTTDKTASGDYRLSAIVGVITDELEHGVDLAVIEDLPTHARAAGITGMVHGAVRLTLINHGIPYVLVTPATLKKYATGRGNADKTAMALAAYKRAGREFGDDNQCDAWWLRHAALDQQGTPEFDMPQTQRDALEKVAW